MYPLAAYNKHKQHAHEAYNQLTEWGNFSRLPGMATVIRLAVRLDQGRTIQEAAAKEYIYRWRLAYKSKTFGVPHTMEQ